MVFCHSFDKPCLHTMSRSAPFQTLWRQFTPAFPCTVCLQMSRDPRPPHLPRLHTAHPNSPHVPLCFFLIASSPSLSRRKRVGSAPTTRYPTQPIARPPPACTSLAPVRNLSGGNSVAPELTEGYYDGLDNDRYAGGEHFASGDRYAPGFD
jgi:hypothetical protein